MEGQDRDARAALVFRALCVLTEAQQQARQGRVARSAGLRLALAYLYRVGDRRSEYFDREPYDEFWRRATQEEATLTQGHNVDGYARVTAMGVCMTGIARAAGMPLETEVTAAIAAALSKDRPVQDA